MSFFNIHSNETKTELYNPLFNQLKEHIFSFPTNNKTKIYCIDGNIGSGKSTTLESLKDRGFPIFKEDVNEWMPILSNFYNDQKRWMFTLQTQISFSMQKQYKEISKLVNTPFVFIERSPLSTLLFIKNGICNDFLTIEESTLLFNLFKYNFWNPDKVFYIKTPVEMCLNRKIQRNRTCESSVTIDYLQKLETEYDTLYNELDATIIDGSLDVNTITNNIVNTCVKQT